MVKIHLLNNKYAKLETSDLELISNIRKLLSYQQEGYQYSPAFRNYGWDGINYLINKNNQFSLGLLIEVENYLKDNKITYEVIDARKPIHYNDEIDLNDRLKELNLVPRDYQLEASEIVLKRNRGVIRAATAAGKTLIAALMTAKLNKPTIIYTIGIDLMDQFHKLFSKIFNEPIGKIGDGHCDIQRINIATVWTIGKALKLKKEEIIIDDECSEEEYEEKNTDKIIKMLEEAKVHILDECHIASAATIKAIYKKINPEHLYGLSGTPYKSDDHELVVKSIIGEQLVNISATRLIEAGVLPTPIIKFINVPFIPVPNSTYQSIYKEYVVENEIRNNIILAQAKNLIDKKYKVLVLFRTINHGKILFKLFKDSGLRVGLLSGKDNLKKRDEVKDKINNDNIDVIVASTIYDIGVDLPIMSALIIAGPTKSYVKTMQRVGRCLRPYPGKKNVAIVDFIDNAKYLSTHSKQRLKIYSSEKAFKVIHPHHAKTKK